MVVLRHITTMITKDLLEHAQSVLGGLLLIISSSWLCFLAFSGAIDIANKLFVMDTSPEKVFFNLLSPILGLSMALSYAVILFFGLSMVLDGLFYGMIRGWVKSAGQKFAREDDEL